MAFLADYPDHMPTSAALGTELFASNVGNGVRNAMPSLHATWALLVLASTWRGRTWIKGVAVIYVALVLLATLGLGEHYLADLVPAAPLALLTIGLGARLPLGERLFKAILPGAALIAAWILPFRFGWEWWAPYPLVLTWAGVVTVPGLAWLSYRRLYGAPHDDESVMFGAPAGARP